MCGLQVGGLGRESGTSGCDVGGGTVGAVALGSLAL